MDFIFLSGGMLANHLIITPSRSYCTTKFTDINRYRFKLVFTYRKLKNKWKFRTFSSQSVRGRRKRGSLNGRLDCSTEKNKAIHILMNKWYRIQNQHSLRKIFKNPCNKRPRQETAECLSECVNMVDSPTRLRNTWFGFLASEDILS